MFRIKCLKCKVQKHKSIEMSKIKLLIIFQFKEKKYHTKLHHAYEIDDVLSAENCPQVYSNGLLDLEDTQSRDLNMTSRNRVRRRGDIPMIDVESTRTYRFLHYTALTPQINTPNFYSLLQFFNSTEMLISNFAVCIGGDLLMKTLNRLIEATNSIWKETEINVSRKLLTKFSFSKIFAKNLRFICFTESRSTTNPRNVRKLCSLSRDSQ